MKKVLILASMFLMTTSAFAGTIRGGNGTRSWCEVDGGNVSVAPTEPPSGKWKKLCTEAGGKIKKGHVKTASIRDNVKTMNHSNKVLKGNLRKLRKLQRTIRVLTSKLKKLKSAAAKLKRKGRALSKVRRVRRVRRRVRRHIRR